MMDGMNGVSLWIGLIFGSIIIVVGVWAMIKFVKKSKNVQKDSTTNEEKLELLIEQYAQGEIDREEFEERRKRLSG